MDSGHVRVETKIGLDTGKETVTGTNKEIGTKAGTRTNPSRDQKKRQLKRCFDIGQMCMEKVHGYQTEVQGIGAWTLGKAAWTKVHGY